ncbi:ComEC/Rec2 family competence protein [Peribacillus sp. NPDC097675]|uniref:ComEC/Rec2 family competence protein n=1 Tax=Peribacillus sp. NPDC097675 TaxID=3390618 RepID=UPI003D003218
MKKIKIFLVAVLFLTLFTGTQSAEAASNVKVHFINVGQGDSILIQTGNENILIDAGGKGKGDEVVAYLKKQKVTTLNAVVSTHPDADHVGGLAYVLNTLKVKAVYAPKVSHTTQAYKDFLSAVKKKGLKIKTAKTGVQISTKAKNTSLKFLAPVKDYAKSDLNNWSAVLLLTHNKKTFLFTGDAEEKSEKDMLAKKLIPSVDVLKVGHHGANTSTSSAFVKKTKPKYAIISVGKNRYGHPTSTVIKRLNSVKAQTYRTDKSGNIIFTSTGTKLTVKTVK